ncbi:MAG TPA: TetR/AcrR family transcriptional regulator, partial [Trebonia sp.]|nr:TetR/AcrR family transcriptional regulator [Trebonia sp.]
MGTGNSFSERTAIARERRPRERRSDAARNHEALVRAATAAVHREGLHVAMATIAADAGVGIGTLYRHFRTREDLLNFLTHRSFEQVLANVQAAENDGTTASDALRRFIEAAIAQRNELVLPLHGGPPVTVPETLAVRDQVHRAVQRIIEGGRTDGTISQDVSPRDVVAFGAMLAQ